MVSLYGSQISTWFVVNHEPIEIRMCENTLSDAKRAAKELGARFFFRPIEFDKARQLPVYGIYDATLAGSEPIKRMTSESHDAPLMYAIMIGGMS